MVMYLPLAAAKDWIYAHLKKHFSARQNAPLELVNLKNPGIPVSPSKANGALLRGAEVDLPHSIFVEDDADHDVEAEVDKSKVNKKQIMLSPRDLAKHSFCIAPLWFLNEVRTLCKISSFCSWCLHAFNCPIGALIYILQRKYVHFY